MFDKNPSTILRWTRDGKLTPIAKLPGKTGAYLYDAKKIQRLASKATA
jgi:predicted site-specific integrase-resolvase